MGLDKNMLASISNELITIILHNAIVHLRIF